MLRVLEGHHFSPEGGRRLDQMTSRSFFQPQCCVVVIRQIEGNKHQGPWPEFLSFINLLRFWASCLCPTDYTHKAHMQIYTHTDTHMCIDTHKTHSTHTVYTHRDIQIHAPYIQTHVHIIHTDIHTCCVLELGVRTIHPEIVS